MKSAKRIFILFLTAILFITELPYMEAEAETLSGNQLQEPEETLSGNEIIPEPEETLSGNEIAPEETLSGNELEEEKKLSAVELMVSEVSHAKIVLSWSCNEEAEGYILYSLDDSGENRELVNLAGTETEYTVSELMPGTMHSFVIVPYVMQDDVICEGEYSQPVSAETTIPKSVTAEAASASYNKIKLSWTESEGVDGYKIYRRNTAGNYVSVHTVSSGDTLTWTDSGLSFNKTYYYKVAPIVNVGEEIYTGAGSLAVSAKTKLSIPKISSVKSVTYKKMKISWGQIAGASGYEIYRSVSANSGYKRIKRVTSGSTLSYTDTTITPNKTYYYKVRAYRTVNGTRVYGSLSAAKSGKTMFTQVTGLKATASNYKTIKLSWNKISSATKYQVYYSTSKNSGYKRLGTVSGNSFTWEKATCGTTYYFKVRAIKVEKGKTIYGNYSAVVSKATFITKPTATAKKSSYNSVKVSWKAVPGAQKYEVYWSTSKNGTYKLLKTTANTFCTHTGRTTGTTYYYKVRSVRQNDKSTFSAVVSAKPTLDKITGLKTGKYSSDGFKISWKAVDGAKQYKVYRSTSKSSGYSLIATVTKNYYVDWDVLSSKVYYYKVVGIRDSAKTSTAGPVSASAKFVRHGIDVSEYQGSIDWKAVENDGIDFAMLRIVKGRGDSMSADARFEEYYKKATAAGLDVGVYRYCYATTISGAQKEAKKVLQVLNGRKLDYPIVLDMEDNSMLTSGISNATRSKIVLAFKEVIEDAGYEFAMYANLNWINNYLDMDRLDDVDIWLARWRDYDRGPEYTGKGNLVMWQYSGSGRVDGVPGTVDLNVSY